MISRPIHRTKTLWLGLLILALLIWAWRDSYRHDSGLRWGNVQRIITISSADGRISIRKATDITGGGLPAGPRMRGIYAFRQPIETPRPVWPPALDLQSQTYDLSHREAEAAMAYWFLTVLFLIPWTSLLLWRRHRIRKLPTSAHQHFPSSLGLHATCHLVRYGWHPWRNVPKVEEAFVESFGLQWQPVIGPFLRSFGGFDHGYLTVWDRPYQNQQMTDFEQRISGIVSSRVVPVASGNYHGENNILWIDEEGRGYLSDNDGLIFVGHNIAQSIETLIFGKAKRPEPPPQLKDALAAAYEWEEFP